MYCVGPAPSWPIASSICSMGPSEPPNTRESTASRSAQTAGFNPSVSPGHRLNHPARKRQFTKYYIKLYRRDPPTLEAPLGHRDPPN